VIAPAIAVAAAGIAAAAAEEDQDQNDDPAAVAATKVITTTHNRFTSHLRYLMRIRGRVTRLYLPEPRS
jgi:hypothetical protein